MDGPFFGAEIYEILDYEAGWYKKWRIIGLLQQQSTTFHRILRMEVVVHNQPLANC